MDYARVVVQQHPRTGAKRSPESRYWRRFKHPVFVKEYAPVTAVHFSPAKPHRYAVTAGTRVQVYAPRTQKVAKTISRFKDVARSASIRHDGKLIVAGDDTGLVQIFDLSSRAILRTLDYHKQPVHVAKFGPPSSSHVLSCSDDSTVCLWDIPTQSVVTTFSSHTDYVRSGLIASHNPSLVLTGSYDGTVRLFDARTARSEMTMVPPSGPSAPVEQVTLFPAGTVALSSSGPILRAWDLVAGGRCVRALSNHQKTVTSLAFDGSAGRLLTGGLDHLVKVYDVSTYRVVHTMRYPAPVLCLAVSPDDTHIAAGMSDGTFSVRRREPAKSTGEDKGMKDGLKTGTYEYFLGSAIANLGMGHSTKKGKGKGKAAESVPVVGEFKVLAARHRKLREYDRFLKKFKYSAALDAVLRKDVEPTIAFSLMQELIHRDGLLSAISGRDDVLLEPLLHLLVRYVSDPRFFDIACEVTSMIIDTYGRVFGQSPLIDRLLVQLRRKIKQELRMQREVQKVRGALDMLFAAATATAPTTASQ
ncbi:WD40 repeat-like protein [Exidia glandulosa HHB12029]|uniref:WD40 repeat-like protein n=1 Tax=Exidia glandulosa HHB12029 TaxID=1314781 RepID=A0A165QYB0_EXIGL|nr:WD40 repeat-like protein [Exidia glandulosa HHB12029]